MTHQFTSTLVDGILTTMCERCGEELDAEREDLPAVFIVKAQRTPEEMELLARQLEHLRNPHRAVIIDSTVEREAPLLRDLIVAHAARCAS